MSALLLLALLACENCFQLGFLFCQQTAKFFLFRLVLFLLKPLLKMFDI